VSELSLEQLNEVSFLIGDLANAYAAGSLAVAAAGVPNTGAGRELGEFGARLADDAAGLLADVAAASGFELIGGGGPVQTGALGAAFFKAAKKTVAARAKGVLGALKSVRAQGAAKFALALGGLGAVYSIGYDWLNEGQNLQLAELQTRNGVVIEALKAVCDGSNPAACEALSKAALDRAIGGMGVDTGLPWWGWGLLAAGGGFLAWQYVKGRR